MDLSMRVAPCFLSRLCGGELGNRVGVSVFVFLSRLCGGELRLLISLKGFTFLSRLCGGERVVLWLFKPPKVSKPPMRR